MIQRSTDDKSRQSRRRKVTVASTYHIYPPTGGGQKRVYHLSKELGKHLDVEIVCLTHEAGERQTIAPGVTQIKVQKSARYASKEEEMQRSVQIPLTDIAMLFLFEEAQTFIDTIRKSAVSSDIVICEQPYLYWTLKQSLGKEIVLDCQNVEYLLKKQMLPRIEYSEHLLKAIFESEKKACQESKLIYSCSREDALKLKELYGVDKEIHYVPNGVDIDTLPYSSTDQRYHLKRQLGIGEQRIALFMGSWHQPNIEAATAIFQFATSLKEVKFLIVGSVCHYFAARSTPANVGMMGILDEYEKCFVLSLGDIALNPITSGSGTNLKMLDYMASGLPVVSTPTGARGLNIPPGLIKICEIDEFPKKIMGNQNDRVLRRAREFVTQNYNWENIGTSLYDILHSNLLR